MHATIREIPVTAEAIQVGRRVRYHASYCGKDSDGLIVDVKGDIAEVILFDGRRFTMSRSHFGGIGIGHRLLDRVHGPALVQKARELAAKREADELLAREKAKRDLADRQRSMKIETAPIFFWNGIKDAKGEKLQKAHYSMGGYTNVPAEMAAETISIYARDYTGFSALVRSCFDVKNDSDGMTDYFETDRIQVLPGHPLYPEVRAAFEAQQAHRERRVAKRG